MNPLVDLALSLSALLRSLVWLAISIMVLFNVDGILRWVMQERTMEASVFQGLGLIAAAVVYASIERGQRRQ